MHVQCYVSHGYRSCLLLCVKMPEEQAFCVLVNIMYQYGLRNLFRQGFEELHLRFYQLERLIQVTLLHSTEKVMFLKKLFRLLGF